MKVFAFILIVVALAGADAGRRDKRTFGSIFQFFGFKLVPLTESEMKGTFSEKYQYPAQTPRNPKFMRLQTVMPEMMLENLMKTASIESVSASSRMIFPSSSEMPIIFSEPSTMTTTEKPTTVDMPSVPMRIVVPDMFTIFKDDPSTENPAMESIKSSAEPVTESMEPSTTQAPSTTTETIPTETTEITSNNLMQRFTSVNELNQPFEMSAFETLKPSVNLASLPLSSAPVQSFESPPEFETNDNFEFYRSNDVTSSFYSPDAFFSLGLFPQNLMPPQPFQIRSAEKRANGFSSATMNMNGQKFNYQTIHN